MGDQGVGYSQALHGSQSFFPRLEPPSRNRTISLPKGLVAENSNHGPEGLQTDDKISTGNRDVREKKTSVDGSATTAGGRATLTSSAGENDEIPIEILSLIDR